MSVRTALRETPRLTFAAMFALLWVLLIGYEVTTAFDWLEFGGPAASGGAVGTFVGQNATAGVVGVAVLVVGVALLITLLAEMGETEPAPEPWPAED